MSQQTHPPVKSEQGFTIVELMIATAVLSTLLVLVAIVMVSIGKLYYKGISQSRIQDDTRNVVAAIAEQLQLNTSKGKINSTPYNDTATPLDQHDIQFQDGVGSEYVYTIAADCIGSTRYTYVLKRQIGSDAHQIAHVLWRDKAPDVGCGPVDLRLSKPSVEGTELIGPNSELTYFSIEETPVDSGTYTISVAEAYGDIYGPNSLFSGTGLGTACLGSSGDEFCATATLTTTITKRLR